VFRIQRRVSLRAAAAPLIRFEEGEFFTALQRESEGAGERMTDVYRQFVILGRTALVLASLAAGLAAIHPSLLVLLAAGGLPPLWLQMRVASAVYDARRAHTAAERQQRQIEALLTGRDAAAEVRVFGAGAFLLDRWRTLRAARSRDVLAAERRRARLGGAADVWAGAAYAGALALVAGLILDGSLSVGAFAAAATGALLFHEEIGCAVRATRFLEEDSRFLADLFAFLHESGAEEATRQPPSSGVQHTPATAGVAARSGQPVSVHAEGISFCYPTRPDAVLRDVSLRIAPGERIAIVGENGAGKTTLAKLLVGLYRPTSGAVWLGPTAVAAGAGEGEVRTRVAAVFQDYATFQLTVRENIGFGDVDRLRDTGAIMAAAERAAMGEYIRQLPAGIDTFLGRQFGHTDLSGGQWQRIALARAFFRDAGLLVLDEPSAALDPLAELALFERFVDLARGRTAVMISHRLGAARLADRIVVLREGRIVEIGRHDALIACGGEYARLFAAQAQWYR
jgi:ABC-type multidrug transport system fused ATPase/permease subunit